MMGTYEMFFGNDKTAEEALKDFGNADFVHSAPNVISYVVALARVRSANEEIASLKASTSKIVTAVEELDRTAFSLIGSQHDCSNEIVAAVDALTKSINRASDESGALGMKVVWLTVFLVAVGLLQALATAWPSLAWWWHHAV